MPDTRAAQEAIARRLPPEARRRLGRIKRAVLDRPEPAPPRPAPKKPAAVKPASAQRPPEGWDRIATRREHIFATAPKDGVFLEIGPAHNGTLARRHGYNTKNVDYLDREGLVAKYQHFEQYDMDDIEEVDYVLQAGSTFSEAIDEKFDVVLASHVLEHSISLIDFINDCAGLLKPGGQIALVVPDHRFCFDRFRERSALSRVIDASRDPANVHTPGTLVEFTLNAVAHRGTPSWIPLHTGKYKLLHSLDKAKANGKAAEGDNYIDVHNWIFSPNHLRLLLQDLADLGYINVRETYFHETVGHEFYLNLSPEGAGTGLSRTELIDLADAERRTLDVPEWRVEGEEGDPPALASQNGNKDIATPS